MPARGAAAYWGAPGSLAYRYYAASYWWWRHSPQRLASRQWHAGGQLLEAGKPIAAGLRVAAALALDPLLPLHHFRHNLPAHLGRIGRLLLCTRGKVVRTRAGLARRRTILYSKEHK